MGGDLERENRSDSSTEKYSGIVGCDPGATTRER